MSTTAKKIPIGATIFLEGEKEFRQAITGINKELDTNKSELSLVTAEYAKNSDSAEALTSKIKVLKEQIDLKTKKVKTMEDALAATRKEYGDNDAKVLAWQKSLNLAKADLIKTTNALDETQKSLDGAGQKTGSLAGALTGLADAAGISVPPAMQGMIDKLDNVSASGAALVGVLAGIAVGLGKLTVDTAKAADDILTMSSTTGLSTDALQEFNYAAELVDVSTETMTGSMTKMIRSMNSAREGSGDAAKAYKELGIRVTGSNGQLKDANEVFYQAIDALGRVKNETERDAISMQIFGKSARDLNPLIEAGSDRLRELGIEAHTVGYVMDEETLGAFGALDDAMQKMTTKGEALKNSLALALLPILTAFFETISKIPTPVLQTIVVLAGVVTTVVLAVKAIKELTSTANTITGFFDKANFAANKTTFIILAVVAALVALAAIIAVISGKSGDLERSMAAVADSTQRMTANTQQIQSGRVPQYARGTSYHPGGLAWVGEQGPELVSLPAGSRVFNAQQSRSMGGDIFNITVDASKVKEFNDIIRMAYGARQQGRAVKG